MKAWLQVLVLGLSVGTPAPVRSQLAHADTSRPAVPDGFHPRVGIDTLFVRVPRDTATILFRNIIYLEFHDTTSGGTVRRVLRRHRGEIVGGYQLAGVYVVRLPDPGPAYEDLEAVLARIRIEPGVRAALTSVYHSPVRNPPPGAMQPPNRRLQLPGAPAGLSIERLEGSMTRSLFRRGAWWVLAPATEAQIR